MHTHHRQGRSAIRSLLRRNALYIGLLIVAAIVWAGAHYLRQSVFGDVSANGDIMALPTCQARLSALGVLPDDSGGLAPRIGQYIQQRHAIYAHMAEDIGAKGLQLGGVITQGLTQNDLFHITVKQAELRRRKLALAGGRETGITILPILKPLDVPVRAMILPLLDTSVARHIGQLVQRLVVPVLPDGGVWVQDSNLFHATVFHASSHVKPVVASESEVMDEHQQILSVTGRTCPIQAVLERVVVTSGGVIVACWQATPLGGEPALLRQALAEALPNAPPKEAQMVKEPTMLHTTLARILQAPVPGGAEGDHAPIDTPAVVQAVQQLSDSLCGMEATFKEVWFIEEQDLLALALQGRFVKHPAPLVCPPIGADNGAD